MTKRANTNTCIRPISQDVLILSLAISRVETESLRQQWISLEGF